MGRFIALFCLFASAAPAFAEFDLLAAARYQPKLPGQSKFDHVIDSPEGGFYAIGTVNMDLLLAKFSGFDQLETSARWDSPYAMEDEVPPIRTNVTAVQPQPQIAVDEDDNLYVQAQASGATGSRSFWLKFGPDLKLIWQIEASGLAAVLPDGRSLLVRRPSGQNWKFEIYSASGVLSASGSVLSSSSTDGVAAVCAVPDGTVNEGFALAGQKAGKAWITRVTAAGAVVFESSMPTPSTIEAIASDVTGVVSGCGLERPSFSYRLNLYKCTPSGELTERKLTDQTYGNPRPIIKIFDEQTATVMAYSEQAALQSGGQLIEFNRATMDIVRREPPNYGEPFFTLAFNRAAGARVGLGNDFGSLFGYWTFSNGGAISFRETPTFMNSATTLLDGTVATGGTGTAGRAVVAQIGANSLQSEREYTFDGYADRRWLDSAVAPNGDIALLSDEFHPSLITEERILTVYNASAKVKYARLLRVGAELFPATKVWAMSDNSFVVAGSTGGGQLRMGRLSENGTILYSGKFSFPGALNEIRSMVPAPGSPDLIANVIKTVGSGAGSILLRVNPAGGIVYSVRYGEDAGGPLVVANGKLFWAAGRAMVRRVNPATGLSERQMFFDEQVMGFADLGGSALCLMTWPPNQTRLRRIDETTLAPVTTRTLAAALPLSMTVGAANRIGLIFQNVAGLRYVSFMNGADLTTVLPLTALPDTVTEVSDMSITNGNHAYLMGPETSFEGTVWVRKYAPNGTIALDKRISLAGPGRIHQSGSLLWLTGTQRTQNFGSGPFAYKYTR